MLLMFLSGLTNAQEEKDLKFLFPFEVQVGVNHLMKSESFQPKTGYGFSFKKLLITKNHFALLSGFSAHVLKFKKERMRSGRYTLYKDMDFSRYGISFPLLARGILGNKKQFFIETGASFGIIPSLKGKGTKIVDLPLEPKRTSTVSEKFIPNYNPDFGGIIGIGSRIPLNRLIGVLTVSFHKSLLSYHQNSSPETNTYITAKFGLYFQ